MTSNIIDWLNPTLLQGVTVRDTAQTVGVTPFLDAAPWLVSALKRLNQLSALPSDWDSYGSPPVNSMVLSNARRLLSAIKSDNLLEPQFAPVSGGGLSIEWRTGQRELEVEILPDGSVEFLRVLGTNLEAPGALREGRIPSADAVPINRLVTWVLGA